MVPGFSRLAVKGYRRLMTSLSQVAESIGMIELYSRPLAAARCIGGAAN